MLQHSEVLDWFLNEAAKHKRIFGVVTLAVRESVDLAIWILPHVCPNL